MLSDRIENHPYARIHWPTTEGGKAYYADLEYQREVERNPRNPNEWVDMISRTTTAIITIR